VVTTAADFDLTICFGALQQRVVNLVYVVDVSGSVLDPFDGDPVGDLNGDGDADTVLDAEIASLINLTDRVRALGFSPSDVSVTLIPFNGAADPTDANEGAGAVARTFSLGSLGDGAIAAALTALSGTGGTNFEAALQAAVGRLASLDPGGVEDNLVYFLSDGAGTGSFADERAALISRFDARIMGVGVGSSADLTVLDLIDNTGGAIRIDGADGLELSPVGRPFLPGDVIDIDLFVNGREIAGVGPEDLVRSGSGFALDIAAADLIRFIGEENTILATVTVTGGVTLTASLEVRGALPRSTDLDL
jgi:hypothetical protein